MPRHFAKLAKLWRLIVAKSRMIDVKALSRVEGEGRLVIRMRDSTIDHVELNIYEPPRFFEALLRGRQIHEVPDITARICGICPVAYQMSSCHALEKALGLTITPEIRALRRLLYCGEWIESHTLHIHLLHAPDFLGFESGISMAATHRSAVERGLRLKKIGNRIVEIVGGRAVHPVNVTVGGFYRAPRVSEIKELEAELQWALGAAVEVLQWVSTFDFPELEIDYDLVSLRHSHEYPMNEGRVVSSSGLDLAMEDYESRFEERHVPQSTALHSVLRPEGKAYLVGPLARFNLCFDQLSATARSEAEKLGALPPLFNNFRSIIVRAIEVIHAVEEALSIVKHYESEAQPGRVPLPESASEGVGMHATEAPRGLLYHRYRIGADGLIAEAKIVPPTSQNLFRIEEDLRQLLPAALHLEDAALTQRCEQLVRNFDPCISCSTHFLRVDKGPAT
jgi:coenzyme F420-reducing hydrogenase alpha subunit